MYSLRKYLMEYNSFAIFIDVLTSEKQWIDRCESKPIDILEYDLSIPIS